jgi:hypothetical protein
MGLRQGEDTVQPAWTLRFDEQRDVIHITLTGPHTEETARAALDAAASKHWPGVSQLWDVRRDVKVAIVTARSLEFGLARMAEAYVRDLMSTTSHVFGSLEEAEAWLTGEDSDRDPRPGSKLRGQGTQLLACSRLGLTAPGQRGSVPGGRSRSPRRTARSAMLPFLARSRSADPLLAPLSVISNRPPGWSAAAAREGSVVRVDERNQLPGPIPREWVP